MEWWHFHTMLHISKDDTFALFNSSWSIGSVLDVSNAWLTNLMKIYSLHGHTKENK